MQHRTLIRIANFGVATLLALWASPASAQCGGWIDGGQSKRVPNGPVRCMTTWDPDGAGPRGPLWVIGGEFTMIGSLDARYIAAWDPASMSWVDIGSGVDGVVRALHVLPDGSLAVGGAFSNAGGQTARRLAAWNGAAWSEIGGGLTGTEVLALEVRQNGNLVVGGTFTAAGPVATQNIASWDGSNWNSLGGGSAVNRSVHSLLERSNGTLIAGGNFTTMGGFSAVCIASWDETRWWPLGSGITAGGTRNVRALAEDAEGNLIVGGQFTQAGGSVSGAIAAWNGSTWSSVGTALTGIVNSITFTPEGRMFVAGLYSGTGIGSACGLSELVDGAWQRTPEGPHSLGSGQAPECYAAMSVEGHDLLVGGKFGYISGQSVNYVAAYHDGYWAQLATGFSVGSVRHAITLPSGELIAAGSFSSYDMKPMHKIAAWTGDEWKNLGSGLGPAQSQVYDLAHEADGNLIASGTFTHADGVPVNAVARWDGSAWAAVGDGITGDVHSIAVTGDGTLYAAGYVTHGAEPKNYRLVRLNGTSWEAVPPITGVPKQNGVYDVLSVDNHGVLTISYAWFDPDAPANGQWYVVAKFDGTTWTVLDGIFDSGIYQLVTTSDGTQYAIGGFTVIDGNPVKCIARWDGSQWVSVGNPTFSGYAEAHDLLEASDGTLIMTGSFSMNGGIRSIARWDGQAWSAVGDMSSQIGSLYDVVQLPGDEIAVFGNVQPFGGKTFNGWGRYSESGKPWIVTHPEISRVAPDGNVVLEVIAASGYDADGPLTYAWTIDGLPIIDGPGGASIGGGTVSGSDTNTLTISGVQPSDQGGYVCTVSNHCGTGSSREAVLLLWCPSDFDGTGFVDSDDFTAFVTAFEGGDEGADVDQSGFVDLDDFTTFVGWFEAGC